MNSQLLFNINQSTAKDILSHLIIMDEHFVPPLHKYVNIAEYAEKLAVKSVRFEIWVKDELKGLLAGYRRDESVFYISNFSVSPDLKSQKAAPRLLEFLIVDCQKKGVSQLLLEVRRENVKAVHFYERQKFDLIDSLSSVYVYQRAI